MTKRAATAVVEPADQPTYRTVELIVPMDLYRRAQLKADTLGEDMAHVARGILYAAVRRDPVGPAPEPEPSPDDVEPEAAPDVAETPEGLRAGLSYTPNVAPDGTAKTRGNTRGDNAAYKNFRFRVPRLKYAEIKSRIVRVPGQTVTYVLERGLAAYVATGTY